MKHFEPELDFGGMVLFDPHTFAQFLKSENITTPKVFQYFIDHEDLGMRAIQQGVVIPIYPIDAEDYQMIAVMKGDLLPVPINTCFQDSRHGLDCCVGHVTCSDIYAIMDWNDADFFLNYRARYSHKSTHNDFFERGTGIFGLPIEGFVDGQHRLSYRLLFEPKDQLPSLRMAAHVDDVAFNIASYR